MPRVALTDRFVAGAKPIEGRQAEYFDSHTKGLALLVGARGSKTWQLHYTHPQTGKRARVALGTYPARSLADARTKALEARGHVEDGNDAVRLIHASGGKLVEFHPLRESLEDFFVRQEDGAAWEQEFAFSLEAAEAVAWGS